MSETKTRPISFRVDVEVLDALEAAGKSAAEISRRALEREASIARKLAALERMRKQPSRLTFDFDVVDFIRKDRDSHV